MSILVATDFSPEASHACTVSAALAVKLGTSLSIVHVLEPATQFPLDVGEHAAHGEVERLHAAQKLLKQTAQKVAAPDLRISTEVVNGFVEDALAAFVRTRRIELLVVGAAGAEGRSSFRDLAEKLAETMPCPVLAVRPITDRMLHALAGKHRLRVVVAIDRTHASDAPIAWVKQLRQRLPCDIFLHHFYSPDVEHRRIGVPLSDSPFLADPTVAGALERELRHRIAGLEGEGDLRVRCEPHFGSISVEAVCSARVEEADLIVVGTHRRQGVARFLHGSVSRDIIRHSEVPVVCVGPDHQARPPKQKIRKVLAATDLSEAGNRAVAYAYDLLSDGVGAVDVIYVATKPTDLVSNAIPGEAARLTPAQKQQLMDKLARLVPSDVDPAVISTRCFVIDGGPAVEAILQAAARWNADAICLPGSGFGRLEQAVAGSVASEITRAAQCPVLVVCDRAA